MLYGVLTGRLKIRLPFSRALVPLPSYAARSPAQLLFLQCSSAPQILSRWWYIVRPASGAISLPPPAQSFGLCRTPCFGKTQLARLHDGADARLCYVQQGLYQSSTFCPHTPGFLVLGSADLQQYFLWYLVFLPLYLPFSTFTAKPKTGVSALAAWVITQVSSPPNLLFQRSIRQALWLFEGYKLEFLGHQTFVPGLHFAGLAFFVVNCVVLGIAIKDVASITIAPTANGDRDTKTQE